VRRVCCSSECSDAVRTALHDLPCETTHTRRPARGGSASSCSGTVASRHTRSTRPRPVERPRGRTSARGVTAVKRNVGTGTGSGGRASAPPSQPVAKPYARRIRPASPRSGPPFKPQSTTAREHVIVSLSAKLGDELPARARSTSPRRLPHSARVNTATAITRFAPPRAGARSRSRATTPHLRPDRRSRRAAGRGRRGRYMQSRTTATIVILRMSTPEIVTGG